MKYVFILNSFTLKDKLELVYKKVYKYCEEKKLDYKIEVNSEEVSTEDIVSKYNGVTLVPVGGDGIINRVLNKMIDTDNILSFIPDGTGNDLYKTVKKQLKNGLNDINVVRINNKYFMNVACFGIDAEIANSPIIRNKYIPKSQRYNVSAIREFFKYKTKNFKVYINNEVVSDNMTTIAVCNGMYYGGGYWINPKGLVDDGKIECYIAPRYSKPLMFKLILSMKNGKHDSSPKIKRIVCEKLKISVNEFIKANIDGEELLGKEFDIEVIKEKIKIYYDQEMIDGIID